MTKRDNPSLNRRSFLKASLAGTLALSGLAHSSRSAASTENLPEGSLSLYNTHTDERLKVLYRTGENYDPEALSSIDHILRCHYTQEAAPIDVRVIEFVNAVDKTLGGDHEIHVISGYRSPVYNEKLIREGHGVAQNSLHLKGKAIDIRIPHVGLDILRQTALRLAGGGVGYYPLSGFVHLDSGKIRSW